MSKVETNLFAYKEIHASEVLSEIKKNEVNLNN